jgi:hypothetical protein
MYPNITAKFLLQMMLVSLFVYFPKSILALSNDTITKKVVSSEQWQQSTFTEFKGCETFPWIGISELPHDSTYVLFPALDQPYGYVSIPTIPESAVIRSEDGVRFYRTFFKLDSLATVTQCRIQTHVDDDVAIYMNGKLLAQESSGTPSNHKGAPHDLIMYNFGPHANGYNGGDPFDFVSLAPTNTFFKEGVNELLLAVRNKKEDLGGFSFRMDYDYVINPEWLGTKDPQADENHFIVYPNPTSDILHITGPNANKTFITQLFDHRGTLVFSNTGNGANFTLNMDGYAKGLYHLHITDGQHIHQEKIVKQ